MCLALACARIGGCPTGEARITPGFGLRARHVIHAVGPVWRDGAAGEDGLLADAHRDSLRLAAAHGLRSVAFPAISTGIYGFPLDRATDIAVRTVREELAASDLPERVVFACRGTTVLAAYRVALAAHGASPRRTPRPDGR